MSTLLSILCSKLILAVAEESMLELPSNLAAILDRLSFRFRCLCCLGSPPDSECKYLKYKFDLFHKEPFNICTLCSRTEISLSDDNKIIFDTLNFDYFHLLLMSLWKRL